MNVKTIYNVKVVTHNDEPTAKCNSAALLIILAYFSSLFWICCA